MCSLSGTERREGERYVGLKLIIPQYSLGFLVLGSKNILLQKVG